MLGFSSPKGDVGAVVGMLLLSLLMLLLVYNIIMVQSTYSRLIFLIFQLLFDVVGARVVVSVLVMLLLVLLLLHDIALASLYKSSIPGLSI